MTTVLVLNGPNLGRLGRREPEVYGSTTHDELAALVEREATELGLKAIVRQSDSEADLLNWVHAAADAGRFTLTSTEVAEGKNMATEQILNGFGCMGCHKMNM